MAHALLVKPGSKVHLADIDPSDHDGLAKENAESQTAKLGLRMNELQDLMFAAGQTSLLVIFQGRDTSGKDGAINKFLSFVNVQSARVAGFKVPTDKERAHDFLWRIHAETPAKGGITVFNRSHYEDVIVVRVHDLVPKKVWKARFDHINNFERLLVDSDTIVLKFYLHISKEEQEQRLMDREHDLTKSWKLSIGDWKERELWDDYTKAYESALEKCSTDYAPWRIVPANHKWFRDLCVAQTVVDALEPYEKGWREHLAELGAEQKRLLADYRAANGPKVEAPRD